MVILRMGKTVQKDKITYYATLKHMYGNRYLYSYGIQMNAELEILGAMIDIDSGLRIAPIYLDIQDMQRRNDAIAWTERKGYTRVVD